MRARRLLRRGRYPRHLIAPFSAPPKPRRCIGNTKMHALCIESKGAFGGARSATRAHNFASRSLVARPGAGLRADCLRQLQRERDGGWQADQPGPMGYCGAGGAAARAIPSPLAFIPRRIIRRPCAWAGLSTDCMNALKFTAASFLCVRVASGLRPLATAVLPSDGRLPGRLLPDLAPLV